MLQLLTIKRRRTAVVLLTLLATALAPLVIISGASADVTSLTLGTAANYTVLGASTVTNTGASTLDSSLGLWPGSAITGFPPGHVNAPGVIDTTNAVAQQAQSDLTDAYGVVAGQSLSGTTTADLGNHTLVGGVYAGPSKGALGLTGNLTLDGANNPDSVFVFQTNSTLITASDSSITLINGAKECNVFWQVGSSATLGTHSSFVGNILALTSITVTTGVVVHGRALAQTGAVTLDTDTFTQPTCAATPGTTSPPSTAGPTTTTPGTPPTAPQTTTTTSLGSSTTTTPGTTPGTLPGTTPSTSPGTSPGTPGTTPTAPPVSSFPPGTTPATPVVATPHTAG